MIERSVISVYLQKRRNRYYESSLRKIILVILATVTAIKLNVLHLKHKPCPNIYTRELHTRHCRHEPTKNESFLANTKCILVREHNKNTSGETAIPIKHKILIILVSRSFDSKPQMSQLQERTLFQHTTS